NGGALTNFFSLPFGQDYYVIVQDGCYRDSAFFKDKTSAGGSELNPFAWRCNTFDIHADGNNYDTVCLWNATTNTLVSCKKWTDTSINPNTGQPWPYGGAEWYNLPYGSYYAYIYDPCLDTLLRIDTTVRYPYKSSAGAYFACMVGQSGISVKYSLEAPQPWTTRIFWPNDSLVATYASSGANWWHTYPTYPGSGMIKVVTEDGCGKRDTSYFGQNTIFPHRRLEVKGGCPGIYGNSGGGDIVLHGNFEAYNNPAQSVPIAAVRIVLKDGQPANQLYNSTQANGAEQDFYFTNLPTGTYVLESTVGCMGFKVYDTIRVNPYQYPLQEQTHVTQCGTNSFVFKDTVAGGLPPFVYEILATKPAWSSLITGPQSSNTFLIPPGASLDTVQMRVTDACGNAHVKDFPVNRLASCLPLPVLSGELQNNNKNGGINVYPNPSTGDFTIAFDFMQKGDYLVRIVNTLGIKQFEKLLQNVNRETLRVRQNWSPGAYLITIIDLKTGKEYLFKQLLM
ncbi:MAG: T9SS type A sorting domain-containing protein, partial [Chitinophagaceae bacterium]